MEKQCDCPYRDWCHEPRQYVQVMIREKHQGLTIKDCPFYKYIKERQ